MYTMSDTVGFIFVSTGTSPVLLVYSNSGPSHPWFHIVDEIKLLVSSAQRHWNHFVWSLSLPSELTIANVCSCLICGWCLLNKSSLYQVQELNWIIFTLLLIASNEFWFHFRKWYVYAQQLKVGILCIKNSRKR